MSSKLVRKLRGNMRLREGVMPLVSLYRHSLMRTARLFCGIDPNKAVFSAFNGRGYCDNSRYISEQLHRRDPQMQIVWLLRDPAGMRGKIPEYVRAVPSLSWKAYWEMATARFNIDNFTKRPHLDFKKGRQFYIQTWHGDRAFKKVGYDAHPYIPFILEQEADLAVVGSEYGERQFRSAFHYRGEILKEGYPRNDLLVRNDPEQALSVRAGIGVDGETGLLLYAPTYRDNQRGGRQKPGIDLSRALDALEKKTGRPWKCLLRAHYLSGGLNLRAQEERILDMTGYGEMAELLLIADVLITDYSSCAGDYALLRRPILLFQEDLEDYQSQNRQLYFAMEDSPYWVARDQAELEKLIDDLDWGKAAQNCEQILEFYGTHETGRASDAVCDYILSKREELR